MFLSTPYTHEILIILRFIAKARTLSPRTADNPYITITIQRTLVIMTLFATKDIAVKVADLNFGAQRFCALPSFGAVTTFSFHTTFSSHNVSVKGNDIDMCSAIYFLFDHNTKYCTIYLCPHTVVATV